MLAWGCRRSNPGGSRPSLHPPLFRAGGCAQILYNFESKMQNTGTRCYIPYEVYTCTWNIRATTSTVHTSTASSRTTAVVLIELGKNGHFLLASFIKLPIQRHEAPPAFRTGSSPKRGTISVVPWLPSSQSASSLQAHRKQKKRATWYHGTRYVVRIVRIILVCLIVVLTFSQEALLVKNSNGIGNQQARLEELPQHAEAVHGTTHPPVRSLVLCLSRRSCNSPRRQLGVSTRPGERYNYVSFTGVLFFFSFPAGCSLPLMLFFAVCNDVQT